jgi:hypothetical protein
VKARRGIALALLSFGLTLGSAAVAVQPAQASCAPIVYRVVDLRNTGASYPTIAAVLGITTSAVAYYLDLYRAGC